MGTGLITQAEVIACGEKLPYFPLVISHILATIDDPDANLNVLAKQIEHDPIIAARVLSLANSVSTRTRQKQDVHDIYAAISMVGLGRVREMALLSSIARYAEKVGPDTVPFTFWQHSIAVGVCAVELAHQTDFISPSRAMVAGLLHDIGALWLFCFRSSEYQALLGHNMTKSGDGCGVEKAHFGVDHAEIGSMLAAHWCLPIGICEAIKFHHKPDECLQSSLVPIIHVAEVLGNALELTHRNENHVRYISTGACNKLGLKWNSDSHALFGCIEARSRHANQIFFQS